MTDSRWERIDTLFNEALDLPPGERTRFLADACAGDEELRREIEGMLEAHTGERALRLEDRLLAGEAPASDGPDPMVGREVGAWRIERLIGRGGMGDVYLAERSDEHYEHRAALKLIRPGLDAQEVTTRFLQERQILAQLEHPNIATLLDGGMTEDGRPYLVMQYVDGEPITDYCESNRLDIGARLELFRTVCEAVHVAHTNLVVHRDLKPANILVTSDGQVKLLDFGIAKMLDPSAPEATRALDRVMTPEHAAPEQVAGEPVTTATDVYALGVLLYQLLTGRRPIEFTTSSASDIERTIREVEPDAPSTSSPEHARTLRGELDAITMMALRKEPERRYPSALELGHDIERYLHGQPVVAERDTVGYRAGKFLVRNRVGVVVAGVIAALVVGFAVMTAVQSRRVMAERDRAEAEREKAESVVAVLTGLLGQANPNQSPGGDTLRVSDLIEQIGHEVDGLDAQPAVQARLWELLGGVHAARSNYGAATGFYERALEYYEADPEAALDEVRVRHAIAIVVITTQGAEAAEPLLRESLERTRELSGERHSDVAIAMQVLAGAVVERNPEEAMTLIEEATDILRANGMHATMNSAALANQLGIYYLNRKDYARAAENFERSIEILREHVSDDHPHVLAVSHNLANTMTALGDYREAEAVSRRTLETRQRVLGPRAMQTGRSWEGLGTALAHLGELDQALTAYENSLDIFAESVGPYTWQTANAARNVGSILSLQGRPEAALVFIDSSIAIDRHRSGGPETVGIATKRCRRTFQVFMLGERERAIADARAALAVVDSLAADPADSNRLEARAPLAVMLMAAGEAVAAEEMMRVVVEGRSTLPETNPYRAAASCMLAVSLSLQGRTAEARVLLEANYPRIASWGLLTALHRSLLEQALRDTGLSTP